MHTTIDSQGHLCNCLKLLSLFTSASFWSIDVCAYVHAMCACAHMCLCVCIHMPNCACAHTGVCVCVCVRMYMPTYACAHAGVFVCVHMYMHLSVCVCSSERCPSVTCLETRLRREMEQGQCDALSRQMYWSSKCTCRFPQWGVLESNWQLCALCTNTAVNNITLE